jgi:transposase-like protein
LVIRLCGCRTERIRRNKGAARADKPERGLRNLARRNVHERARRRQWTAAEKAALLAEIEATGGQVSVVAQRHGIAKSLLYNWRSAWKAAALAARGAAPGSGGDDIKGEFTLRGRSLQCFSVEATSYISPYLEAYILFFGVSDAGSPAVKQRTAAKPTLWEADSCEAKGFLEALGLQSLGDRADDSDDND